MMRSPGLVVRTGRVRSGGHDGEVHPMVPLGQQATPEIGRHVGFGTAGQRDRAALQGGRRPDRRRPQPRRNAAISASSFTARSGPVIGARLGELRWPATARCRSTRNRDQVRSPMAAVASAPAQAGDHGHRVLGLLPGADAEDVRPLDHPWRFEPGHDERRVVVARHDQHREAFERHRLVAGQPRKVGPDREQQDVDPLLDHRRSHPSKSLTVHGAEPMRPMTRTGKASSPRRPGDQRPPRHAGTGRRCQRR